MRFHHLVPIAFVLSACGGDPPPPLQQPSTPKVVAEQRVVSDPVSPKPFENPGGMWMPHQMKGAHAAKLKELGLAIDPAELSDPASGLLQAVVSLGGCSASFVSGEGLIATNHHCATGALQHNSNPSSNLLKDGWLAKTRADEKNNGPQARVFVTQAVTDVTSKIRPGLEAITDDLERFKEIEKRQKEIVAACEKGRPQLRCTAASFYEGASYYLVEQLEIRDVRLVWAPPAGIGNYGGEIDNWRWPRHTGDVSFFRAYVGKDGMPADFSAENVAFKPAHHLKIASAPLREGDLVMVAGYPGRTATLQTKLEAEQAVAWGYPRRQKMYEDYLASLAAVTKDDKEAQIRATSYVRRFNNALTNVKGQLEGLTKGGLAGAKAEKERALRASMKDTRALDDLETTIREYMKDREAEQFMDEIAYPRLVSAALTIARMAEERAKPDAEREPAYQQRNWARHEQAMRAISTSYHRKVDEAVLRTVIERMAPWLPAKETNAVIENKSRQEILHAVELFFMATFNEKPEGKVSELRRKEIRGAVTALYTNTKLDDEKVRVDLLKTATPASLAKSSDWLVQVGVRLNHRFRAIESRRHRFQGALALLKPAYIEALRAFEKSEIAPDANGTLRITYGTVKGYRPTPDAQPYRPFTVLSEVVAKHKGQEPFDVPKRLLDAHAAKKVGPYVDAKLGDVPVDFLSDLHITGGNSGSATLNAKGELTGLVFDGNYEAMASDWVFVPSITRSIHVDVRYVLWLLDAVDGGDHLLREMAVEPKISDSP